ncbi:hypothetical protein PFICI_05674 [Pestalotiopsis fici W106-1]|uniref:Uncharacterized protein n=1 Tax=Pestalotiopsis fici (strain W106-1 / CGMCC3.15140) TaxID=1229662 RepID=W3XCI3_PESFW|nr:uncharacterized protein PFICI_05674 [Pestalotiopsis fici W106-1]ETS83798.1 hypothetical protein PFICI_05674 [Pestalotiopsis fici W106-1]
MMFAFSLIRALALLLRIAQAGYPTNGRLAIAASVLTMAGTILVFIINLFFAQRILRGYHPNFGWSKPARIVFRFLVASVVISLLMVIISTVQSFFTLDEGTRMRSHKVQLFGGTYMAVLAFLPIPIVVLAAILPRKYVIEKFGSGSWRAKLFIVLFVAAIESLGAGFRAGTNFVPRPMNDPAWYDSRAAYYVFNFVFDLIVTYLYLLSGFHRRFHVPNGANGPGSYMGALPTDRMSHGSLRPMSHQHQHPHHHHRHVAQPASFQSCDTLTTQQGRAPSPKMHNGKLHVGYTGYQNASATSLKKGGGNSVLLQQQQQRKQRNRLSKSNPRPFGRSNASLASQDTYVGSIAPSIAETPSSMYRGYSPMLRQFPSDPFVGVGGGGGGGVDTSMPLPPVPALPASATAADSGLYGASPDGTIHEEPDYMVAAGGAGMVDAEGRPTTGSSASAGGGGRARRPSDVLSDMLDKMESVRESVEMYRKRGSVERTTSDGLQGWRGGLDFEDEKEALPLPPPPSAVATNGVYRAVPTHDATPRPSLSSSRYATEFDDLDSDEKMGELRKS